MNWWALAVSIGVNLLIWGGLGLAVVYVVDYLSKDPTNGR